MSHLRVWLSSFFQVLMILPQSNFTLTLVTAGCKIVHNHMTKLIEVLKVNDPLGTNGTCLCTTDGCAAHYRSGTRPSENCNEKSTFLSMSTLQDESETTLEGQCGSTKTIMVSVITAL